VIGPNGAGKSNLMDAISFVLGVRSAQLRSSQLKDLIYRAGDPAEDAMDVDGDEAEVARTASVVAVYEDQAGQEYRFQRSISAGGTSEYRLNGTAMTYAKYNAVLEKHNILVKAKNFLVFQGDVEAVAQQSPKDLVKLIEQVSGSGELKDEYDRLKVLADKASESSTAAFNKRKGFNTEIKQFKEQKAEALRFDRLREARDDAVVRHCVWKLCHLEKALEDRRTSIKAKAKAVQGLKQQQAEHEAKLKAARKEQHRAQKEATAKEKQLKQRERAYDERKPELLALEAQMAHSTKKIANADTISATVAKDRDAHAKSLKQLEKDLTLVQKAARQHAEEARKASQATGLTLSEEDQATYRKLRAQANTRAVPERQQLETRSREARVKRDVLNGLQDKLDQDSHKKDKLLAESETLDNRKATVRRYSDASPS
jgi:structural maintenance of chromosome 1